MCGKVQTMSLSHVGGVPFSNIVNSQLLSFSCWKMMPMSKIDFAQVLLILPQKSKVQFPLLQNFLAMEQTVILLRNQPHCMGLIMAKYFESLVSILKPLLYEIQVFDQKHLISKSTHEEC